MYYISEVIKDAYNPRYRVKNTFTDTSELFSAQQIGFLVKGGLLYIHGVAIGDDGDVAIDVYTPTRVDDYATASEEHLDIETMKDGKWLLGFTKGSITPVGVPKGVNELRVPDDIFGIQNYAFENCEGLHSIKFDGSALKALGVGCFADIGAEKFAFPASIEGIDTSSDGTALIGGRNLTDIYILGQNKAAIEILRNVLETVAERRAVGYLRALEHIWVYSSVVEALYEDIESMFDHVANRYSVIELSGKQIFGRNKVKLHLADDVTSNTWLKKAESVMRGDYK